jgi:hypothetical protein
MPTGMLERMLDTMPDETLEYILGRRPDFMSASRPE